MIEKEITTNNEQLKNKNENGEEKRTKEKSEWEILEQEAERMAKNMSLKDRTIIKFIHDLCPRFFTDSSEQFCLAEEDIDDETQSKMRETVENLIEIKTERNTRRRHNALRRLKNRRKGRTDKTWRQIRALLLETVARMTDENIFPETKTYPTGPIEEMAEVTCGTQKKFFRGEGSMFEPLAKYHHIPQEDIGEIGDHDEQEKNV